MNQRHGRITITQEDGRSSVSRLRLKEAKEGEVQTGKGIAFQTARAAERKAREAKLVLVETVLT
jgi:hypothetical protein